VLAVLGNETVTFTACTEGCSSLAQYCGLFPGQQLSGKPQQHVLELLGVFWTAETTTGNLVDLLLSGTVSQLQQTGYWTWLTVFCAAETTTSNLVDLPLCGTVSQLQQTGYWTWLVYFVLRKQQQVS
jgi:hypothetical protein